MVEGGVGDRRNKQQIIFAIPVAVPHCDALASLVNRVKIAKGK